MTPERFEHVEQLFRDALEMPTPERALFLESRCRDDSDLRREVESLLASHEVAGSFLDAPMVSQTAGPVRTFRAGDLAADRFRILRFLAEGGMGEVYVAEDTVTSEQVAVKTVRPSFLDDEEAEQRFVRESQLARKVTHVNVCRTYDVFEHRITLGRQEATIRFLTMELLAGETLGHRLRRSGALSLDRAQSIGRQIAAGLAAAHDAGVVHRDLKPDNVILVPGRDGLRAVVTDFGLARDNRAIESPGGANGGELLWVLHSYQASAPSTKGALARMATSARRQMKLLGLGGVGAMDAKVVTELGRVMGTPAYMSPEQAKGERGDERADVWSFGVVLYEMLSGKLPYCRQSSFRNLWNRLTGRGPSPAPLGRHVPKALRRTLARCLAIEPEGRYPSGHALLEALEGVAQTTTRIGTSRGRALLYGALVIGMALALLHVFVR